MSGMNGRLTRCPDCGKEVSKSAKTCPHCGAPLSEQEKVVVHVEQKKEPNGCAMFIGIIFLIIGAYFFFQAIGSLR